LVLSKLVGLCEEEHSDFCVTVQRPERKGLVTFSFIVFGFWYDHSNLDAFVLLPPISNKHCCHVNDGTMNKAWSAADKSIYSRELAIYTLSWSSSVDALSVKDDKCNNDEPKQQQQTFNKNECITVGCHVRHWVVIVNSVENKPMNSLQW